MSEINYDNVKLIVENNMREAGFQGNFENGWKETIVIDNTNYQQQFNLQGLRDIITKSIVDAITDAKATGTVSTGNIQGNPVVIKDQTTINLTKQQAVPSFPAARQTDSTEINAISDPIFIAWIATISAAVNSLSSGSVPIVPTSASGKITSGSNSVKIGN